MAPIAEVTPPPSRAHVFAETDDLKTTASEIAAKLRDRKKWFVLAGDGKDADVVVRVLKLRTQGYMRTAYTPEPTGEDRMMPMRPDAEEVFHLEAEVVIGQEPPLLLKASGPRPKDAVFQLAKEIERRINQS